MKITAKVDVDAKFLKDFDKVAKQAAEMTADAVLTEVRTAQVMPHDTGNMEDNSTFTKVQQRGKNLYARVITDSPQARRLYYHPEYDFQTVNNPSAGAGWFDPWAEGGEHEEFAQTAFYKFMQRGLKR